MIGKTKKSLFNDDKGTYCSRLAHRLGGLNSNLAKFYALIDSPAFDRMAVAGSGMQTMYFGER